MPKYTAVAVQPVDSERSVILTDAICCNRGNVLHGSGSGVITLRGLTNQCFARYRITFNGNVSIPSTGTVGAVSIALAVKGEALASATATVTPAAVSEAWAVNVDDIVDVPRGCCVDVSVKNVSGQAIDVSNGNLIVERVA